MNKYIIKILPRAYRDIDGIYFYIADEFKEISTAEHMAEELEKAILGLCEMPYRGTERKVGVFANKGYRQIFVKSFTIVYRIEEKKKQVVVVTVRYMPSNF